MHYFACLKMPVKVVNINMAHEFCFLNYLAIGDNKTKKKTVPEIDILDFKMNYT